MLKRMTLVAGLLGATAALAQEADLTQAPPPTPYQAVSELVDLPEFLPGLGQLFVDPATLPAGPFLAYDHDGRLSATVYMTPLQALEEGDGFNDLGVGAPEVTGVDIYYNAGHPGVEEPHAHVVLYHDAEAKSRLAQ